MLNRYFVLLILFILSSYGEEHPSILLHPIFHPYYSCTEHWAKQLQELGDALGTDCHIQKLETIDGRSWLRSYRGDGHQNEDWYTWQQPVMSPISGVVSAVNINPVTNTPGIMGKGMASYLLIEGKNEIKVLVGHLDSISVKKGDVVTEGEIIGVVGNNGYSRHPHIHLGAFRQNTPLQIRFDQNRMIPKEF